MELILKTLFLYFLFLCLSFFMNKKEMVELKSFDFITWILIIVLAAISLEPGNSLFISVIPIIIILVIQIIFKSFIMKSKRVQTLISGNPTVIIKNGKLMFREIAKCTFSLEDLISELREQGIQSIDEVNFAVIDKNGKISVCESGNDYPLPLILDGRIDYTILQEIHKDEDWLMELLLKRKIELEDVFYAFYIQNKTFVIKRE